MQRWLVLIMIFALCLGGALAQDADVTTITLPPLVLEAGASLIYEIEINCLADGCSAFDITLSFDPALIQVDELEVGPYLGEDVFEVENAVDAEAGTLRLAAAVLGDLPETEDTVLLRIHLTALDTGEAAFTVEHVDIGDLLGNPVEVEVVEGEAEATPTVEPTTAPTPVTCEYTVQAGDTLNGIAMANHITLEEIMALNNITDARFISIGQKLQLPSVNCVAGLTAGSSGQARPGGRQYFEVWDCRHLGSNVFEWYGVEVSYDSAGNPVSERRVDGPHTGEWRPGCPAGERPPSGGGRGGDDDDGGSSGGGQPPPV
jgi:LysM repeat protein